MCQPLPQTTGPESNQSNDKKWYYECNCNAFFVDLWKAVGNNKQSILTFGLLVLVIFGIYMCRLGFVEGPPQSMAGVEKTLETRSHSRCFREPCVKASDVKMSKPQLKANGIFTSKIIIPFFGGLVTAIVILLVMKELWNQNENAKRTLAAKIFDDAVQNLGSKEHAKVLGAVYALNDLARTYPNYREGKLRKDEYGYSQTVFETLCGFIRVATYTDVYSWNLQEERRNISSTSTPCICPQAPGCCPHTPQKPDGCPKTPPGSPSDCKHSTSSPPYPHSSGCGSNTPQNLGHCSYSSNQCKPESRVHTTSLVVIQTIINRLFLHPDKQNPYKEPKGKRDKFRVSLRGADLRGVDFFPVGQGMATIDWTGADLRHVNLQGANFKETELKLQGADLWRANLSGANMKKKEKASTDLSGANLQGANLSVANVNGQPTPTNLSGANLSGANLSGADLSGADLSGADLTGVCLKGTIFTKDTILTGARMRGVHLHGSFEEAYRAYNITGDAHTFSLTEEQFLDSITFNDENGELVTDINETRRWFRSQRVTWEELRRTEVEELRQKLLG